MYRLTVDGVQDLATRKHNPMFNPVLNEGMQNIVAPRLTIGGSLVSGCWRRDRMNWDAKRDLVIPPTPPTGFALECPHLLPSLVARKHPTPVRLAIDGMRNHAMRCISVHDTPSL